MKVTTKSQNVWGQVSSEKCIELMPNSDPTSPLYSFRRDKISDVSKLISVVVYQMCPHRGDCYWRDCVHKTSQVWIWWHHVYHWFRGVACMWQVNLFNFTQEWTYVLFYPESFQQVMPFFFFFLNYTAMQTTSLGWTIGKDFWCRWKICWIRYINK